MAEAPTLFDFGVVHVSHVKTDPGSKTDSRPQPVALKDRFAVPSLRKGRKKSIGALARTMLRIIFATLKKNPGSAERHDGAWKNLCGSCVRGSGPWPRWGTSTNTDGAGFPSHFNAGSVGFCANTKHPGSVHRCGSQPPTPSPNPPAPDCGRRRRRPDRLQTAPCPVRPDTLRCSPAPESAPERCWGRRWVRSPRG
jgi:hypothetical protein